MIKPTPVLFFALLAALSLAPYARCEDLSNDDLRRLFPPTLAPIEGQTSPPPATEVPYCDLFRIPQKIADYGKYFPPQHLSIGDWASSWGVPGANPDAILYDADQRSLLFIFLKKERVANYTEAGSFQMLPALPAAIAPGAVGEGIFSSTDFSPPATDTKVVRSADMVCRKMARCECIKGGSTPATAAALIASDQAGRLDVVVNAAVESVFKKYGDDMLSEAQKAQLKEAILSQLQTDNGEVADKIKDIVSAFLAQQRTTISKEVAESISNQPEFRVFIQRELQKLIRSNPPRRRQ